MSTAETLAAETRTAEKITAEKITVVARAGRWRMRFRVDPTTTPPTESEAQALGAEIAAVLLAAFDAHPAPGTEDAK